jgi:hypothetical protein
VWSGTRLIDFGLLNWTEQYGLLGIGIIIDITLSVRYSRDKLRIKGVI